MIFKSSCQQDLFSKAFYELALTFRVCEGKLCTVHDKAHKEAENDSPRAQLKGMESSGFSVRWIAPELQRGL